MPTRSQTGFPTHTQKTKKKPHETQQPFWNKTFQTFSIVRTISDSELFKWPKQPKQSGPISNTPNALDGPDKPI